MTDPGVLELGGDPVTVKVSVPGRVAQVVLAIGRDTDVAGWVGTDAHGQVTGLSAWHDAGGRRRRGPGTRSAHRRRRRRTPAAARAGRRDPHADRGAAADAATAADPTGSDLWVAQETGTGSAELVWPAQEGRWSLHRGQHGRVRADPDARVAARGDDARGCGRASSSGSLLVLLSGWLLLRDVRRRRAGLDEPSGTRSPPAPIPAVLVSGDIDAIPVLTRRQLREAAQAHATKPRSGPVPQVPHLRLRRRPRPRRLRRAVARPVPTAASATAPAGAGDEPPGVAPAHRGDPGDAGERRAPEHRHSAGAWAPTPAPTSARTSGPGTPPPPPGRPSGRPPA